MLFVYFKHKQLFSCIKQSKYVWVRPPGASPAGVVENAHHEVAVPDVVGERWRESHEQRRLDLGRRAAEQLRVLLLNTPPKTASMASDVHTSSVLLRLFLHNNNVYSMNTTCSTVLVSIYLDVSTCCEELK